MAKIVTIPGETVPELIEYWGTTVEWDTPAFVSIDKFGKRRSLNRQEVLLYAKRFAYKLRQLGISKGSIVCNTLPNSLERIICEFAIICTGAASMNGQIFRADGSDLMNSLKTAKCSFVILDPNLKEGARKVLLDEVPSDCEKEVKSPKLPYVKKFILCERNEVNVERDFLSSLKYGELPQYITNVQQSDLATVMTTSGSTGYSKLVKLTHRNICHFCLQVKAIEPLAGGDRFLNTAPLGWAGGYPQWYLSCGVTRYFIDMHAGPPEDLPSTIWKTVVEEKIVYGFLSPMYVNAVLTNKSLWEGVKWKPKILCLAGQPVKVGLLNIIGRLCDAVDINYGTTECNLITTHRITDPKAYVDGCAGFPGYGVELKVVDKDGNEVPKGMMGEVVIKTPSLTSGYLNSSSESNASFISDGWFHTDDAGYIGEDQKLYVEGRQSDSIMRGAYIVYPGWLEKELRLMEGVKDVVVVPVPDPVLHNEICAVILTDVIKGMVAGTLSLAHGEASSSSSPNTSYAENDLDETDDASFNSIAKHQHEFVEPEFLLPTFIESSSSSISCKKADHTLEHIRRKGMNMPLTVSFNDTKVVKLNKDNGGNEELTHKVATKNKIRSLEEHLQKKCSDLLYIHKKDPMRMVPKYYVFTDSFVLTDTGKINRKEIRALAASMLKLTLLNRSG